MLLTIFTPTYNRAYILKRLYDSLCCQTNLNFEWVVVDDGSTDETSNLLLSLCRENKIRITYIQQENGGKHRAINKGILHSKGEIFFIVDSDDYLTPDAVQKIMNNWESVHTDHNCGGLCFRRINHRTNHLIGGKENEQNGFYSSLEIAYQVGIIQDKAEIFRTDLMKKYPFPEIPKEKFVPESLIWNRITESNKLFFINEGIYICEYLEDGLSANFSNHLKKAPKGLSLFYKSLIGQGLVPFPVQMKAIIRLTQCYFYIRRK